MKKILLIIAITLLIFQLVVLATAIDIGNEATIRKADGSEGYTIVDKTNPANATGTITSVEIYVAIAMTGCEIAIFDVVSGNNLSTRSSVDIGDVAVGYNQFDVNLDVEEGDYIGIWADTGSLRWQGEPPGEQWYLLEDQIPCTDTTFSVYQATNSIGGTGTTEVGWSHKWNTKTISKWNTKEITKWNELE